MGGFPALRRDVLQWLITLNLSQPIKNVRRDFSNGFLVAEIFSQYFPQDVQMHSFDNGTKLAKKKDNWDQLEKIFRKKEFPLVPGEIDNIINCGPEDGIGPLLERMYWFLARKSSKPQEPHIQELWTGLPVNKPSTEESLFDDLNGSISLSGSGSLWPQVANNSSIGCFLQDFELANGDIKLPPFQEEEKYQHRQGEQEQDEDEDEDEKEAEEQPPRHKSEQAPLSHRKHTSKKQTLNAVERARQKELKQMAKAKPAGKQPREPAADPGLAFRSPKRERHFKSYTLNDYKRQQALGYVVLGKLGPDSTQELRTKRETLEKMKEFGRTARSIVANQNMEPRKPKEKPLSTREKALKFATTVPRPKKKETHSREDAQLLQDKKLLASQPLSELEILEAKYLADKQNLEAMRRDLEIFLR